MSVRLEVARALRATPVRVWDELVDWHGQDRWIPLTHVRVTDGSGTGLGARVSALSGFRLGPVPVGLLDRFVVTGWTPPTAEQAGEFEVLHLGPYFTGPGVFRVEDLGGGRTRLHTQSLFDSYEARDGMLASGMDIGVNAGYAKLDRLLAEGAA